MMDMGNTGGRFIWYELATIDVNAAKAFYTDVMGWGTAESSTADSVYTLFTAANTPVAGLTKLPAEALRTGALAQWTGYVGVEDVDATVARVKQLGGTVYIPPTDLPNVSRFSVIADPQRATLVLVKGRERGQEEAGRGGVVGRVSWHELRTSGLETAFAFYNGLFGWEKAETRSRPAGTYQNISVGTDTFGGMSIKPAEWPRSIWYYYFNVAGIEAAAKRVTANGGQVLYDPMTLPEGGRVIECLDPQGVPFALIDTQVNISIGCYSPRNRHPK